MNRQASRNPEADIELYQDLLRAEASNRMGRDAIEVVQRLEADGLLRITDRDLPADEDEGAE